MILIILFSSTVNLQADDFGDFKEKIEQEEQENKADESDSSNAYCDDEESSGNEESSPFWDFIWDITFLIWFLHNDAVYYTPYPYEITGMTNGDNFIGHDRRSMEEIEGSKVDHKNYFFTVSGGATINENAHDFGGFLRFTGKFFNHLGPEIDYRLLWDGQNLFHNFSGGLNLSFFQFDYFSLDFYIKAALFAGSLEYQGVSLGGKIKMYPFKPISLEVRSGGIFFSSLTLAEVEVKVGVHIGPAEIFGDFYTLQSSTAQIYSFGLGMGYHF